MNPIFVSLVEQIATHIAPDNIASFISLVEQLVKLAEAMENEAVALVENTGKDIKQLGGDVVNEVKQVEGEIKSDIYRRS